MNLYSAGNALPGAKRGEQITDGSDLATSAGECLWYAVPNSAVSTRTCWTPMAEVGDRVCWGGLRPGGLGPRIHILSRLQQTK